MFGNGVYLSVLYCLCYEMNVSADIQEDQLSEEKDQGLNEDEDIRIGEIRNNYGRDVAE